MKNINFEKYTTQEFMETFGKFYAVYSNVLQLSTMQNVEQNLYMCLAEYYEDGEFVDVFNTGFVIMRYTQDTNAWAVYAGNKAVYITEYFDKAKAYVIKETKNIEY